LISNGIDVVIDAWNLRRGEDIPKFMEGGLSSADRVLMICTERYVEKAAGALGGVGYEKMIVTAEIIRDLERRNTSPSFARRRRSARSRYSSADGTTALGAFACPERHPGIRNLPVTELRPQLTGLPRLRTAAKSLNLPSVADFYPKSPRRST